MIDLDREFNLISLIFFVNMKYCFFGYVISFVLLGSFDEYLEDYFFNRDS